MFIKILTYYAYASRRCNVQILNFECYNSNSLDNIMASVQVGNINSRTAFLYCCAWNDETYTSNTAYTWHPVAEV
jgi:hypothetical protein